MKTFTFQDMLKNPVHSVKQIHSVSIKNKLQIKAKITFSTIHTLYRDLLNKK